MEPVLGGGAAEFLFLIAGKPVQFWSQRRLTIHWLVTNIFSVNRVEIRPPRYDLYYTRDPPAFVHDTHFLGCGCTDEQLHRPFSRIVGSWYRQD
jgi:hypothetical protein